jgi:hypothetical protein
MIDPKELRIGNLVTIDNPNSWPEMKDIPCIVIGIQERLDHPFKESTHAINIKNKDDSFGQFNQFINPILLVESELFKFGFEKKPLVHWHGNGYDYQPKDSGTRQQDYVLNIKGENDFTVRFEEYYYKDHIDSCRYILDCDRWYERISEDKISCSIEYVHHLQNIFYCLKARELLLLK